MNGGTPYLVPWPALPPPAAAVALPPHLTKLAAYSQLQQPPAAAAAPQLAALAQFPQLTAITLAGGQVYPFTSLSLPPTIINHQSLANSIPKYIIPGVKVCQISQPKTLSKFLISRSIHGYCVYMCIYIYNLYILSLHLHMLIKL